MRIGILTFHNTINYGATLQAYALYRTICELTGYDVEVIDYLSECVSSQKMLEHMNKERQPKRLVHKVFGVPFIEQRLELFSSFIENNVTLSKPFYTRDSLRDYSEYYDIVVTGSDQIFNMRLTHNDTSFLLDFVSDGTKKIAYAASFGNYNITDFNRNYAAYLNRFTAVSLRERELTDLLHTDEGVPHEYVLDPTFLLSKEQWLSLVESERIVDHKYILLFLISPNKELIQYAKKAARAEALPIVSIPFSMKDSLFTPNNVNACPPLDLIRLIRDSEMVLTNSYHGTILSINLNKEVRCLCERINPRIEDILGELGLIQCLQNVDTEYQRVPIDFSSANKSIVSLRQNSIDYLQRTLL